jgi:hypothetical protein
MFSQVPKSEGLGAPGYLVYPHPYFGRKVVVFLRLQTGLRCKIVKTKEFLAKSSRIRSYGPFRPLLAEWWREEGVPGHFEGKHLSIIVRLPREILCKGAVVRDQRSEKHTG